MGWACFKQVLPWLKTANKKHVANPCAEFAAHPERYNIMKTKMMETVRYDAYYHPLERKSYYVPNLNVTDYENGVLFCPKCSAEHSNIPHGKNIKCKCGLYMERWGNSLQFKC